MKKSFACLLGLLVLFMSFGTVKAEGEYISGYTLEAVTKRSSASSKSRNVGYLPKFNFIMGYKYGNWIKLYDESAYIYNYGIVENVDEIVEEYAPSVLNIRNKPNGKIVGKIKPLQKIKGLKIGNWIIIGRNKWIYDSNVSDPERVSGYLPTATNIRSLKTGKVIKQGDKFDYIGGRRVGKYIITGDGYLYNYGLLHGDHVIGYLPSKINVRKKPNGSIVKRLPKYTKIQGIKSGNWTAIGLNQYIYGNLRSGDSYFGITNQRTNVRSIATGKVVKVLDRYTSYYGDLIDNRVIFDDGTFIYK